ncbi:MAG: hypothetical protein R2725_09070 [Solirubrobacterales bacterium]
MGAALDPPLGAREVCCALCGHRFDPDQHAACQGCPLGSGCALSCCPACGFSTADPSRSRLVRVLRRLRR